MRRGAAPSCWNTKTLVLGLPWLQLDMRNLSLGRRHLVNAYEVEAGIGVIAGNAVWSMPERLECEVLQKARYIKYTHLYLLPAHIWQ